MVKAQPHPSTGCQADKDRSLQSESGQTTGFELPFVSAHVDASGLPASLALFATGNPVFEIGAAISAGEWGLQAAENLIKDPIGTVKGAVNGAVDAGKSVVNTLFSGW